LRLNSIALEKELLDLTQKQTLSGINTDINRQIKAANLRPTGDKRLDEQLTLRVAQTQRLNDATTKYNNLIEKQRTIIDSVNSTDSQILAASDERDRLREQLQLRVQLLEQLDQAEQAQLRFNQTLEAAKPFADAFASGLLDGITGIVEGTKTAEQAFANFLNNIAKMLLQTAQQMIAQYIALGIARTFAIGGGAPGKGAAISGGFGQKLFADGGAFAKNKIIPYAKGGIVNKPTMFAYGDGGAGRFGLMGEAGPEAILPLKRGPGGRLGVESSGEVGNVVVNVDAKGTAVQGDNSRADQLGRLIGAAVQAELIKQKRPGGLLTR